MKTQLIGLAVAATTLTALAGCNPGSTLPGAAGSTSAIPAESSPAAVTGVGSAPSTQTSKSHTSTKTTTNTTSTTTSTTKTSAPPSGPRIVYFKIAQKPKCAEGTAVFRAPAVPLIIKWKITGATSAALSVDDPTNTPGTYGPEGLEGSEEFTFTCAGAVGTIETHSYAIYTVGGGTQRSKKFTVSAKVLDKGIGSN